MIKVGQRWLFKNDQEEIIWEITEIVNELFVWGEFKQLFKSKRKPRKVELFNTIPREDRKSHRNWTLLKNQDKVNEIMEFTQELGQLNTLIYPMIGEINNLWIFLISMFQKKQK